MNKKELSQEAASRLNTTDKYAAEFVDLILDLISESLVNGDKVALSGFGTFELKERAEREGRNPRTGDTIVIPGKKAVTFKPGKSLKEAVNE